MTQRLVDVEIIWVGPAMEPAALFYACRMREHVNDVGSVLCSAAALEREWMRLRKCRWSRDGFCGCCYSWDLTVLASCWMDVGDNRDGRNRGSASSRSWACAC
ncbi:hypothetical protein TRIATDRAFT_296859 [Trichoderma atroviride IMI 206040]|uniref:Uncharacterized protein n=1 Tax=Hypocrea atroviridis (strain ATCC 20476 / IMI 206040) TaxID=452589 RepID=G9NED5_HYPAI|nr:uncharacterized protein TRIATDRAFT_296859 [Trichoderma atroviride IMI 206040]EHK51041.1 hypothetical protein TRIATDRAFT_296859 [Trichoderma atroviride IMI 206040]